jgi:hypothetical protein
MKLPRLHTTSGFLFMIMFLISGGDLLFGQITFTPDPDSKLWIEGRSNVNQFSCEAVNYQGEAVLLNQAPDEFDMQAEEQVKLQLQIPVRSFECGRSRMNRDLYNALRSEEFLYIEFEFSNARNITENGDVPNSYILEITGILTVAGTSRAIDFKADGYILEDGRLRAVGKKAILMTDYDVEPPTGLLGLVRAENELTVHFDLYASPTGNEELSTDLIN